MFRKASILSIAIIWVWSVFHFTLDIQATGLENPFLVKTYQWLFLMILSLICLGLFILLSRGLPRKFVTILGAGVSAATLFFQIMSPMGISSDYYRYIWQGRISNGGQDNYSLVPWAAGVEKANKELFERMDWRDARSVYPPLAEQYFRLPAAIFDSSLFKYMSFRARLSLSRIPNLALYLLCGYLIYRLSRRRLYGFVWLALPLFQFELVNSAHVDVLSIALVLGALLATKAKSWQSHVLVGALVAAAGMVKLTPFVLILPIAAYILVNYSLKRLVALLATFVSVTAVFSGPFLANDFALVTRISYWLSGKEFSFGNPMYEISKRAAGNFGVTLLRLLTIGSLALIMVRIIKVIRDRRMDYDQMLGFCLALLLLPFIAAPIVLPWYWVMPLTVIFLLRHNYSQAGIWALSTICVLLVLQYADRAVDTSKATRDYVIFSSSLILYISIAIVYRKMLARKLGSNEA